MDLLREGSLFSLFPSQLLTRSPATEFSSGFDGLAVVLLDKKPINREASIPAIAAPARANVPGCASENK
jgi:hypothetical protein